ncbi:MAG: hypothetical protein J6C46_01360 [Clostridia bacterium]|nr:hypothetical protein [Clostridia bacterium]
MVAIIIVAIILTLVAVCGYILYNIKNVRKNERNFYDIFVLYNFFCYIQNLFDWQEFIRSNERIIVKRRILIVKKVEDLYLLNFNKDNIFDLRTEETINEKSKMAYSLVYEFILSDKSIELCLVANNFYPIMFRLFANTEWILNIDENKVKMLVENSFKESVYIPSWNAATQSLSFIFHKEVQRYNDTINGTLRLVQKKEDTKIIIDILKDYFNFNQYQRQSLNLKSVSIFNKREAK